MSETISNLLGMIALTSGLLGLFTFFVVWGMMTDENSFNGSPIEIVPLCYKNVWKHLTNKLNKIGSIIAIILFHIIGIVGIIVIFAIIYLVFCPFYYLGKLFCKIFPKDK